MQQLTLRGFDPELELRLRQIAKSLGLSLNKAALFLMRKGAGLDKADRPNVVGHSVDHLIGVWSEEDEREFRDATRDFDRIDAEFWS